MSPHSRAQSAEGVVGEFGGFGLVLEGGHGEDRGDLPGGHEERNVAGDDLTHDAQGLTEVERHRVVVNLGRTFLQ
jgi:hypothetical protein